MIPGTREQASIFSLDSDDAYKRWRDQRLATAPKTAEELLVEIRDISRPDEDESRAVAALIRRANMAVYVCHSACDQEDEYRAKAHAFSQHFGLERLEEHRSMEDDGQVAIEIVEDPGEGRRGFIPYTNKPISWHTDGYYNLPNKRIKAMTLHCVRPAIEGGVNDLFDPEIAYIRLRDENPEYIRALSHRRAMSIPSFVEENGRTRPECSGPVFTWDRYTGDLHMRFTERKRNIVWNNDEMTKEAVAFLLQVLASDEHVISYRMRAGEGLICNNVLHTRSGFTDDTRKGHGRLMLRARYLDRIDDQY